MLRGRAQDDGEKRDESLLPDRLIHFDPEDSEKDTEDAPETVFGTYYKAISSDKDNMEETILFSSDGSEDTEVSDEPITPESIMPEYSPVVFEKDGSEDQNVMDESFPLFLSFKANDSAKTVSEAIRDRAVKPDAVNEDSADSNINDYDHVVSEEVASSEPEVIFNDAMPDDGLVFPEFDAPNSQDLTNFNPSITEDYSNEITDPFDIALEDLDVPVFKPFIPASEDNTRQTYDIPEVFDKASDTANQEARSSDAAAESVFSEEEPTVDDVESEPSDTMDMPAFVPFQSDESLKQERSELFGTDKTTDENEPEEVSSPEIIEIPDDRENMTTSSEESSFSEIPETIEAADSSYDSNLSDPDRSAEHDEAQAFETRESPVMVIEEHPSSDELVANIKDDPESFAVFTDITGQSSFDTSTTGKSELDGDTNPSVDEVIPGTSRFFDDFDFSDEIETPKSDAQNNETANMLLNSEVSAPIKESPEDKKSSSNKSAPVASQRPPRFSDREDNVASVLRDEGMNVFESTATPRKSNSSAPVRSSPEVKERPGRQYSEKKSDSSSKSAPVKGVQPLTNLDRPGSKYMAAQQMGTVTPHKPGDRMSSRRTAEYLPLIILLLIIVVSVIVISLWNFLDLGTVFKGLFGNTGDGSKASTYQSQPTVSTVVTDSAPTSDASMMTEAPTPTPTSTPTPSPSPSPSPSPTPSPTPSPSPTPGAVTRFRTKLLNASIEGDLAYFDWQFENTGSNDSTLKDSILRVTVTYTAPVTFDRIECSAFIFEKKEGTNNVFIGTPTSTELIKKDEKFIVDMSAYADGKKISTFSVKYFVEYN